MTPHADQAIVEAIPIIPYSCGDEPGAGGASIVGQEHPGDDDRQAESDPAVHDRLQGQDHRLHNAGQRHAGRSGLPAIGIGALQSPAFVVLRLPLLLVFRLRTLRGTLTMSHP